jgi:serine/threonine-protein kinase HipA
VRWRQWSLKMQLTLQDEAILQAFEHTPELRLVEIEEITGIPRRTLQRSLKKLVDAGLVSQFGQTRNQFYRRVYQELQPLGVFVLFSNGELAGELEYGAGLYRFSYYEKYSGSDFPGLIRGHVNESNTLFPFFENLIPEHERREKLLFGKVDLAQVLPELGNAHGALEFIPKEELYKYKSDYRKRPNWITIKNKVLGDNPFPNILDFDVQISDDILNAVGSKEHSNLSGYQTKIDVNVDWDQRIVTEAHDAQYLLKPRNLEKIDYFGAKDGNKKRYYPFLALNEHLFMSFAKNELGFNVPYTAIIKADIDFHYLTKRYDRFEHYKYEQFDFAQLLSVGSEAKYKSSNEVLFKKVNEVLTMPGTALEALRFYFYGYLIKHADLHLKNIGILNIGQNKYILAPLYDVISVGIYKGDCDDLGLPFSHPYKKPRNLKLDDFYRLGEQIGVSKLQFKKEAAAIARAFLLQMPNYIDRVREIESHYNLNIQDTRQSSVPFSDRLQSMFERKIISLKKLDILEDLGLLELAGGPLARAKKKGI